MIPRRPILFAALLLANISCKPKTPNESDTNALITADASAWKNATAGVCWLEKGFDYAKTMIAEHVQKEFLRAGFHFTGFKPCSETPWDRRQIRVKFVDDRASSNIGDPEWERNDPSRFLFHFDRRRQWAICMECERHRHCYRVEDDLRGMAQKCF